MKMVIGKVFSMGPLKSTAAIKALGRKLIKTKNPDKVEAGEFALRHAGAVFGRPTLQQELIDIFEN